MRRKPQGTRKSMRPAESPVVISIKDHVSPQGLVAGKWLPVREHRHRNARAGACWPPRRLSDASGKVRAAFPARTLS
jgi:hypothetical protein